MSYRSASSPLSRRGFSALARAPATSAVPVLAAEDSLRERPRRIAVGVDLREGRRLVAQGAARWAGDDATVFPLHARPLSPAGIDDAPEWHREYDERARG